MLDMWLVCVGLCMGSFIGCAVSRKEKILSEGFWEAMDGRSECDCCGEKLKWYELIPVVCWVAQGGKCRNCKEKIPARFLMSEVFAGITALMFSWMDWKYAVVLMGLYLGAVFDAEWGEVPYWVTDVTLGVATVGAMRTLGWKGVVSGVVMYVVLRVLYQLRPGSIGGADVNFMSAMCMYYTIRYIPVLCGLVGGLGLLCLAITKEKGLRMVPVLWVAYLCMYWISL